MCQCANLSSDNLWGLLHLPLVKFCYVLSLIVLNGQKPLVLKIVFSFSWYKNYYNVTKYHNVTKYYTFAKFPQILPVSLSKYLWHIPSFLQPNGSPTMQNLFSSLWMQSIKLAQWLKHLSMIGDQALKMWIVRNYML